MTQRPALIGLLLAAGRGRRMGCTKQLLPWPDAGTAQPLVAAAFDTISRVCESMIVVLGHEAEAVAGALGKRTFTKVRADADGPMFESIRLGLQQAQVIGASADILLHPADQPEVKLTTLDTLIAARSRYPGRALIPQHCARAGHPVLIPAKLIGELIAYPGVSGLRRYWIDHPGSHVRVEVNDEGVLRDIDTPEDYCSG